MTKRAILYSRVSTDEQAINGYSLGTQQDACRVYAVENSYSIVGSFSDDYTGAVPIEQRPEGRKAFQMLRGGQADALIVYRMDRLVRPPEDGDEWDTPVLIRSLARLNKEIHTVDCGQIKTDFASLLTAMLDARTAGEERRKMAERTSRGRYAKAKSGKVICSGKPPFGYEFGDGTLVLDPIESEVVRLIYRWYIEDHLSLRAIVSKLHAAGYPTPRGGPSWHCAMVARILRSELYIGKYYYGVPSGHKICVPVPRLVTDGDFEVASQIRKYNAEIAKRNRRRSYLLSGMVRCGCGFSMTPQHYPDGSVYYRCTRRVSQRVDLEKCYERNIRMEKIEKIVWDYIYHLLSGDFETALQEAQKAERAQHEPQLAEIAVIDAMLSEAEVEAEQLAKAMSSASGIVLDKLQREGAAVTQRYDQLRIRRESIAQQIAHRTQLTPEAMETLMQFRERIVHGLTGATEQDKRKYYEILQVRALVKDGRVQVSCMIASHCS